MSTKENELANFIQNPKRYLSFHKPILTKNFYPVDILCIQLHLELNFDKKNFNNILLYLSNLYYNDLHKLLWDLLYINYFDFYTISLPNFVKIINEYKKRWKKNQNISYIIIIAKTLFNNKIDQRVYNLRMISLNYNYLVNNRKRTIYKNKKLKIVYGIKNNIKLSIRFFNYINLVYYIENHKTKTILEKIIEDKKFNNFKKFKVMCEGKNNKDSMKNIIMAANIIQYKDNISLSKNIQYNIPSIKQSEIDYFKQQNLLKTQDISQKVFEFDIFEFSKDFI